MNNTSRILTAKNNKESAPHPDISYSQGIFTKSRYAYWRLRIMYSIILGYGLYNLGRINLAMAVPAMKAEFGFDDQQIGMIMSATTAAYASGRLCNGLFSDKANARYFHVFGLLGVAFCNLLFGVSTSINQFAIFWALNGWFQTMGAPSCSRMLTHWHASHEIGTRWAIWSSNAPLAGGIIFLVSGYTIPLWGWQSAFLIPAAAALLMVPFLLNRLRDNPGEVGLPPIEQYKPTPDSHVSNRKIINEPMHLSVRQIVVKQLLPNQRLWFICMASFCLYLVRIGFLNWCPEILIHVRGLSLQSIGKMGLIYEVGCLIGGLGAGFVSDHVFKGQRGPVGVLYMLALAGIICYFGFSPYHTRSLDGVMLILFGFFSFGPNVLVGAAAADFASKKAVGIATGVVSSFGNIGGTISGVGIGYITKYYGWESGLAVFAVTAVCGAVCFGLTLTRRTK
ncbi:MAG: MFS transporter [Alphaproteobacteria bacterium]|nr:MAG: MFS transporter [Alphaproteobacteria bacterium]